MEIKKDLQDNRCRLCGKPINADDYNREYAAKLKEQHLCFSCNLWTEHHELDRQGRAFAIINGSHFTIGPEKNVILGFGGAEFRIRFNDGRHVTTHNLWHQGKIPEHFREMMPDNACFE